MDGAWSGVHLHGNMKEKSRKSVCKEGCSLVRSSFTWNMKDKVPGKGVFKRGVVSYQGGHSLGVLLCCHFHFCGQLLSWGTFSCEDKMTSEMFH